MHAPLATEHGDDICAALVKSQRMQALKERAGALATVLLLYDSGQLLMVANEDKAVDTF